MPSRPYTRRSLIAGAGAGACSIASAGCLGRVRNIAGRDSSDQLVLTIRTVPSDTDSYAMETARHLSENLQEAGIDARVTTTSEMDLYRYVLLNHDFDVFVGQYPHQQSFDPDALYPLCHPRFTAESGWQNPFGFSALSVESLLDEQRTAPHAERPAVVGALQESIAEHQPFTVVAFPDALTATRSDRFADWAGSHPTSSLGLLSLADADGRIDADSDEGGSTQEDGDDESGDADSERSERPELRLVTTDRRITENRNPIAAEYRRYGSFTGLLYDPLVRTHDGESIPWLAVGWDWHDDRTVRVILRDATWHDGVQVTSSDIAFTYTFLADTSLGTMESPVPSPRFRGRSTLVESVETIDEWTADITMVEANRDVAERALTVPLLPEHVWNDRTDPATIGGFEVTDELTEALVSNNPDPVGSGPIRFVDSTPEESVEFERNPDHFLTRSPSEIPEPLRGGPAFGDLSIEVVPSDLTAVQYVSDGRADATVSTLGPDAVPRIGRASDVELNSTRSAAFYLIGYNTRRAPLSNPGFRQVLSQLIDKRILVDDAFQGYAAPASTPLATTPEWVPESLAWDEETDADPVFPFLGTDGELDTERIRDRFREIGGYHYNEDGELLVRNP